MVRSRKSLGQLIYASLALRIIVISLLPLAVTAAIGLRYYERSRLIEGTWLYQFEGSQFFEGATPTNPCDLYKREAAWLAKGAMFLRSVVIVLPKANGRWKDFL
jgi:hypothetical protein